MKNLEEFEFICRCGHNEIRIMRREQAEVIKRLRGQLYSEMDCNACIKPENDPRKCPR